MRADPDPQRALVQRPARLASLFLVLALVAPIGVTGGASAQEGDDFFSGLGSATLDESDTPGRQPGEGSIQGTVLDAETGRPVSGVTVIVMWPEAPGGAPRRQEVVTTDFDGYYVLPSATPGRYDLSFVKSGYRSSAMTGFEVVADTDNVADFPLPPIAAAAAIGGSVLDLDEFVVEASTVGEMMSAIELRLESDSMLDIMSAEDFSKYAASDVADALKRVVGVNVVEGQFAIIRGLEDRYSSTLYNHAPVPSPDPTRQSVQLDLFPSEVVSNVIVAKTFSPELPGNSGGGNIDIITHGYPDSDLIASFKMKGGLNDRVLDNGFTDYRNNSAVGKEHRGEGPFEVELGGTLGGRVEKWNRELRFTTVGNFNRDFGQKTGTEEQRAPRNRLANRPNGDLANGQMSLTGGEFDFDESEEAKQLTVFGAIGVDLDEEARHVLDASFFWTKKKQKLVQERTNGYLPGFDYSIPTLVTEAGDGVDRELFLGTSGDFPGLNAAQSAWITDVGARDLPQTPAPRGPLWFTNFNQSASFKVDRDLKIVQLNGEHDMGGIFDDVLEGLQVSWAGNYAKTSQDEDALRLRYWYEPCGQTNADRDVLGCPNGVTPIGIPEVFPVRASDLGPGTWVTNRSFLQSANEIDEEQWFGRIDVAYEHDFSDWLVGKVSAGYWYENAERDVDSNFVDPQITSVQSSCLASRVCIGNNTEVLVTANNPLELSERVFGGAFIQEDDGLLLGAQRVKNESERTIEAWNLGLKTTWFEDLDVFGGVRFEDIEISSDADAFVDTDRFGFGLDQFDLIFPSKFLLFDRFGDNRVREFSQFGGPFNDELINFPVDRGICHIRTQVPGEDLTGDDLTTPGQPGVCTDLVTRAELSAATSGKIDENKILPSVGLTYRVTPLEEYLPYGSLTLRAAYSQTVARPSFREKSYYVSLEPGTDDQILGNPALDLSEVESWDGRVEWVFSDTGDLIAFGGFYKEIDDPVESLILRDPTDATGSAFAQFRTFFNNPNTAELWGIEVEARKSLDFLGVDFLEYFSIGGNYTYIDAQVDRTDPELEAVSGFFPEGETLDRKRRLFGQPEWIANADISFDHPDWGTRITIAYFMISDILDATGVVSQELPPEAYVPDLYIEEFHTLDLVARQRLYEGIELSFQAKNLTDSRRGTKYDTKTVNGTIRERSFRVGRDFKLQLTFTFDSESWF